MIATKCRISDGDDRRICPRTAAAASGTTGVLLKRHLCHLKYLRLGESGFKTLLPQRAASLRSTM